MGLKLKVILIAIIVGSLVSVAEAAWQGPVEVLTGTWGSKPGQFTIKHYDIGDGFPKSILRKQRWYHQYSR